MFACKRPFVCLAARRKPEPDIAWVVEGDYSQQHPGPDEVILLIEVAESSVAIDLGDKAEMYAAAGIREYWVVDLPHQSLVVHREPADGRYQSVQTFPGGIPVRPLPFSEVVFPPRCGKPGLVPASRSCGWCVNPGLSGGIPPVLPSRAGGAGADTQRLNLRRSHLENMRSATR